MAHDHTQRRPRPTLAATLKKSASEPAIYGVVLVAGLLVILADGTDASWRVLVKVLATLVVFWLAHVYAGVVAHLGDSRDGDLPTTARIVAAVREAFLHSRGMLLAGVIPVVVLALGVVRLLSDPQAIWGTLWTAVAVLGALGWIGVAAWSSRPSHRLLGAVLTSLLGMVLVTLKALVH